MLGFVARRLLYLLPVLVAATVGWLAFHPAVFVASGVLSEGFLYRFLSWWEMAFYRATARIDADLAEHTD